MQDRKEYILEKAFEVFMTKGYDSSSMTVLQQELKISRGAMYRYYDSKDDLFKAVVDRYFFGLVEYLIPTVSDDTTLYERIEQSYHNLKKICRHFDEIDGLDAAFLNYTAFVIQAAKVYPNFIERMRDYKEKEVRNWQKSIENSIKRGEVRSDVDVKIMSQIFAKAFDMNDPDRPGNKCFSKTAENTRKMMKYVYSLIKT